MAWGSVVRIKVQSPKIWVDAAMADRVVYHPDNGEFVISLQDCKNMIAAHELFLSRGWQTPLLREHEFNGEQSGTVHKLRLDRGPEGIYLQALISFGTQELVDAWNAGKIRSFSPRVIWDVLDPETGEKLPCVMFEFSHTSLGYQRFLRDPYTGRKPKKKTRVVNTASGIALSAALRLNMEEEELEVAEQAAEDVELVDPAAEAAEGEMLAAIAAKLDAIYDMLSAKADEMEGEAVEAEQAELAGDHEKKLSARVEELELKLSAANTQNRKHMLARKGLSSAQVETLSNVLSKLSDDEFAEYCALQLSAAKPKKGLQVVTEEVGGAMPEVRLTSPEAILSAAQKEGHGWGSGLGSYLAKEYPEQRAEVLAIARERNKR